MDRLLSKHSETSSKAMADNTKMIIQKQEQMMGELAATFDKKLDTSMNQIRAEFKEQLKEVYAAMGESQVASSSAAGQPVDDDDEDADMAGGPNDESRSAKRGRSAEGAPRPRVAFAPKPAPRAPSVPARPRSQQEETE